jgi:hypothetical protein
MPNFCINRLWRTLFQYTPLLLMLTRWFVFWILETALTQFYKDKSGQRARQKSMRISENYVRKSAPGLLLRKVPGLFRQADMI